MRKTKGVSLIIPIFNEEKTLKTVIKRCANQNCISQIIVVNDGSTDNSKNIIDKLKTKITNLSIINHNKNLGKGSAIKNALKKATGKYVMIQDADLEYYPEEIGALYKEAEKSKYNIVFGSRTHYKKKGYLLAQIGNWYLNKLFNFLFGLHLTDSYTCYKLIPRTIWNRVSLKSNGFEIDSELVSKLGNLNFKIIEIPISYNPRKYSEGKKINWFDLINATIIALKVKFKAYIHP